MSDTEKPMKQKEALEIFKDLFNSRDYSEQQKMEAIKMVLVGNCPKFYKRVSKDDYRRAAEYLYLITESNRSLLEFTFEELRKNGYTAEILKEKFNAYREKNKQTGNT